MHTNKRTLLAAAIVAALLPLAVTDAAAAVAIDPAPVRAIGATTDVDYAIDRIVFQRKKERGLSTADAQIYREQLQLLYLALPAAARTEISAAARNATSAEALSWLGDRIVGAAGEAARQAMAATTTPAQAVPDPEQRGTGGAMAKLGSPTTDLVFVPTAGPCRVADTRLNLSGSWPGPVAGFTGRQIYGYSVLSGWDYGSQGGTGFAGSGNCAGTYYPGAVPTSVVATVAVVNTSATGYLRAWNGGTTLTVGGILGWNAGDVLSNTTVIPMNRSIPIYPGSGPFKRDFAVYNNSGSPVDVIVDVVGYFIENEATALDCVNVTNTSVTNSALDVVMTASACPTGYTPTGINCASSALGGDNVSIIKSFINPLGGGTPSTGTCRFRNAGGASQTYWGYLTCCRVPGR
ncbi:MAG: hypothetical protein IT522_00150 [Burkholderiales bacterium]|nr:hypothetical protein [Burkholderiales bacterium]